MISKKKFTGCIAACFLTAFVTVPSFLQVDSYAVIKPEKVTLTNISSPAYNKLKINWNGARNATHYKIYYKESDAKKWDYVATTNGNERSFTHKSNGDDPIKVGQKYTYTVKGYNKPSNTNGNYDKKGLTGKTKPSTVSLDEVSMNSDGSVNVSWHKAKGNNYYFIYRKTSSSGKWQRIGKVKSNKLFFTDKNPVKGKRNYYTVRGYYSPTKTYGNYDKQGLYVDVKNNISASGINIKKIELKPNNLILDKPGSTKQISATISPSNASNKNLTWKSTDTSVATVVNGKVVAKSRGTATIIATATDGSGVKGRCEVFVLKDAEVDKTKVSSIMISEYPSKIVSDGGHGKAEAKVYPSTALNKNILWSVEILSGKPDALTVDSNGCLVAHGKLGEKATVRLYAKSAENPKIYNYVDIIVDISEDFTEFPKEVLRLTNIERAKYGLYPLKYHPKVQNAAMIRAKELNTVYSHVRPDGKPAESALWESDCGGFSGENIAMGYKLPESVIRGWMNSPLHKRAILSKDSEYLGVGFFEGPTGTRYWSQMFAEKPDLKITLSFDSIGGSTVNSKKYYYNQTVNMSDIEVPIKPGYRFVGWQSAPDFPNVLQSVRLNVDRTIYAKWIPE